MHYADLEKKKKKKTITDNLGQPQHFIKAANVTVNVF